MGNPSHLFHLFYLCVGLLLIVENEDTRMSRNGHRKWTYSPKNTSSSPSMNRSSSSLQHKVLESNGRAHWYVAIICNLDNAKPRNPAPKMLTRTQTKSQLDIPAPPEPIDVDNMDISAPESRTPSPLIDVSRPSTPGTAPDAMAPPRVDLEVSEFSTARDADVIDVDAGEAPLSKHFRRMSISSENVPADRATEYDYQTDLTIDSETKAQIAQSLDEDSRVLPVRYTRSTLTMKDSLVIDDEPSSITSGLKQKYQRTTAATTTTSRRTSGKPVPLDSYHPPTSSSPPSALLLMCI